MDVVAPPLNAHLPSDPSRLRKSDVVPERDD